jgi:hypothetical protein
MGRLLPSAPGLHFRSNTSPRFFTPTLCAIGFWSEGLDQDDEAYAADVRRDDSTISSSKRPNTAWRILLRRARRAVAQICFARHQAVPRAGGKTGAILGSHGRPLILWIGAGLARSDTSIAAAAFPNERYACRPFG